MSKKSKKKELQGLVKLLRDLHRANDSMSIEGVSVAGEEFAWLALNGFGANVVDEITARMPKNLVTYLSKGAEGSLKNYVYNLVYDDENTDAEVVKELCRKIKWCDDYEKVVFNCESDDDYITFGDVIHMIESMDSLYGVASSVAMASEEIEASCIAKADEYKSDMLELGGGKCEDSFSIYVNEAYEDACDIPEESRSQAVKTLLEKYDKDADAYTLEVMGNFLCDKSYCPEFRANVLVYGLQV